MNENALHSYRPLIVAIMLLALALRCISVFSAPPPQKDGREYELLATHLVAGNGFSFDGENLTAARPPGYPFFIASIYTLFGPHHRLVGMVEAFLGALTCLCIYGLAARLFERRAALIASFLWAINPLAWDSYFAAGRYCMESLVALLLIATLIALWMSFHKRRMAWSFAAGLLLGVSLLTKGSLILLPVFLAPIWIVQAYVMRSWQPMKHAVMTGAICVACMAPWIYRNHDVFDAFVPVSTSGGLTYYRSNNVLADGGHNYPAGGEKQFDHLPEIERSRAFYELGNEYLEGHRDKIPWLVYRKNRLLMDPFYKSRILGHDTIPNLWLILLAPISLIGFLLLARRHTWWTLIVLATAAELVVVTSLFHGYARYRFPYDTVIAIYAGAALNMLWGYMTTCRVNS